MSKRAAAAAQTRQRIVEATCELHGEQGIAATSWDDIAARAGVGVGTVYRHFPSLDELIPACGAVTWRVIAPPDPPAIAALFEDTDQPAERMETLVREAFAMYDRAAPWLHAIRRDGDVHPGVSQSRDDVEVALRALVDAALAPFTPTDRERAVVRAMIDLGTWEALRAQGLGPEERVAEVAAMLAARPR